MHILTDKNMLYVVITNKNHVHKLFKVYSENQRTALMIFEQVIYIVLYGQLTF